MLISVISSVAAGAQASIGNGARTGEGEEGDEGVEGVEGVEADEGDEKKLVKEGGRGKRREMKPFIDHEIKA